jgi:hypothetical protein
VAYKCYHCGKEYYDMHDLMEHKNAIRQHELNERKAKYYNEQGKREQKYIARKEAWKKTHERK